MSPYPVVFPRVACSIQYASPPLFLHEVAYSPSATGSREGGQEDEKWLVLEV